MKVATTTREMDPSAGVCVFVPTMGALHEGHAVLIRRGVEAARERGLGGGCVVSIFVNPTQFNDQSDFARYPRTLEADVAVCAEAGASCVFVPRIEEVYPRGAGAEVVALPDVATRPRLEDAFRPGHFAGVCQVVKRLFEMVRPAAAVFGEKDWQQLQVVRAMTAKLGLGIEIVGVPTVRECDGLAMSSRNRFLSADDRVRGAAISRALSDAGAATDADAAERIMRGVLAERGIEPDYAVVREAESLERRAGARRWRALIAAKVGTVRLIDNAAWAG